MSGDSNGGAARPVDVDEIVCSADDKRVRSGDFTMFNDPTGSRAPIVRRHRRTFADPTIARLEISDDDARYVQNTLEREFTTDGWHLYHAAKQIAGVHVMFWVRTRTDALADPIVFRTLREGDFFREPCHAPEDGMTAMGGDPHLCISVAWHDGD